MSKPSRNGRPTPLAPPHRAAIRHLTASHAVMARVIRAVGPCTFRPNPDLFTILINTVISQQISVKAAMSIGQRLREAVGRRGLTPAAVRKLPDEQLRAARLAAAEQPSIRTLPTPLRDRSPHA